MDTPGSAEMSAFISSRSPSLLDRCTPVMMPGMDFPYT